MGPFIRKNSDAAAAKLENEIETELSKQDPIKMQGYVGKFIDSIKVFTPAKKVDLLYKSIVKKDPSTNLTLDNKLGRILYELDVKEKTEETNKLLNDKKTQKKFKWSWKQKREMKKSFKFIDKILVFYYTITGDILGPRIFPIYSGNMIIISNKPYELDPRAVWRMGKFKCVSIKEIDRRPISNLDWDEVKKRGDATHSDEFLIKAAMRAYSQSAPAKKPVNWWVIAIAGIVIVGGLIWFFSKGSTPVPVVPKVTP
jgi:hypothetical protein